MDPLKYGHNQQISLLHIKSLLYSVSNLLNYNYPVGFIYSTIGFPISVSVNVGMASRIITSCKLVKVLTVNKCNKEDCFTVFVFKQEHLINVNEILLLQQQRTRTSTMISPYNTRADSRFAPSQ